MREKVIECFLVQHVRKAGGEVRKVEWPGRRGAPDRLVMFPDGELTWVELKTPLGRVEPWQEREHQRLRSMGQAVLVLRSKTDIMKAFPL